MRTTIGSCTHRPLEVAGIEVVACEECGMVEWSGPSRSLDPSEGMAALFGNFRLVGRLPALHGPGEEVLMYRPPNRRSRENLDVFPAHVWLQVDINLWLTHDGEHLLLVPTTTLLMDNLTREA